jgi:tetratricopeptide (TPR) repeat protein
VPHSVVDVSDVAGLLRSAEGKPIPCSLLIGAGVSRSAGIGLAADFVRTIKDRNAAAYRRAQRACGAGCEPSYSQSMAALTRAQQTDLVRTAIKNAKINWSHLGIVLLEGSGYIDSILTTNFDPLAARAFALFNSFPAIYDLAALRDGDGGTGLQFDRSFVSGTAIYHLHGQHSGFLLLNSDEKLRAQAERIAPVLNATMKGRPVIICGYSGDNDPLIEKIATLGPFTHGLIWVCYDDCPPSPYVCEKLLGEDCFVVKNAPSDIFFDGLLQELGIGPPRFLWKPFDHMLSVLETVVSDPATGSRSFDLINSARERLLRARDLELHETPESEFVSQLMAEKRYREVWDMFGTARYRRKISDEPTRQLIAWAAIRLGNEHYEEAMRQTGDKAVASFRKSRTYYRRASSWSTAIDAIYFNMASALKREALWAGVPPDHPIWCRAVENFEQAARIDSHQPDTFVALGETAYQRARLSEGKKAQRLFATAAAQFRKALGVDPDFGEAMVQLANTLLTLAASKRGAAHTALEEEAAALLERSAGLEQAPGSYNIACIYGRMGDLDNVVLWIRKAHRLGDIPSCDHILHDPDFELVRDAPQFAAIIKEIGCSPPPTADSAA